MIYFTDNVFIRKKYLFISLFLNLGLLGYFKYFGFFLDNLNQALFYLGFPKYFHNLSIILPVGISFYTFQSMSYTIDIYRRKIIPEKSFINFSLYVSFFPQLIAGPIERSNNLLSQLTKCLPFNIKNLYDGFWLFFLGLFQKLVIADNLSILVDWVFEQNVNHDGWLVLLATYAFSFQILADFSGYTNMARGLAKFFGINLSINFKSPYLSANPKEFWKSWHITLSEWLKDYLYIPLGGNKKGRINQFMYLMLTMLLGGLWHGASWNFIIWGGLHGLILIIYHLLDLNFKFIFKKIPKFVKIIFFYHFICFTWIIFRTKTISDSWFYIKLLFFNFNIANYWQYQFIFPFHFIMFFYGIWQFFQHQKNDFETPLVNNKWMKILFYLFLFYSIIFYGNFNRQEFIYFQF